MKGFEFRYFLFFICFSAILIFAAEIKKEDSIVGLWVAADGNAKIRIEKIGKKFQGKVVWLKAPNDLSGKLKTDRDSSFRKNPIIGLKLMEDFTYAGESQWKDGKIYDPETGNFYSCELTLKSTNNLEVSKTEVSDPGRRDVWKRQRE